MRRLTLILIVVVVLLVATDILRPNVAHAGAGLGGVDTTGVKEKAVLVYEKPTKLKIGFGVGMLIAGILAVKYL